MSVKLAAADPCIEKLHIDFACEPWRVFDMASNDLNEIDAAVATLLLAANALMEDASVKAASVLPTAHEKRCGVTSTLRDAGRAIAVLTAAAHILASMPSSPGPTTTDS